MKLLLDTHILLWASGDTGRLSQEAVELLSDASHRLIFSAASLWEVAIKASLGKADFDVDVAWLRRGLLQHQFTELPVAGNHAIAVVSLPKLHKDPFDRILVAQAAAEDATLVTSDQLVAQYPGSIRLV